MTTQGGDDLDDFGDELLVSSAEGDGGSQWDNIEDVQALMSPDEDAKERETRHTTQAREKKRKRREKDKERKAKVRVGLSSCSHTINNSLVLQKRKLVATIDSTEQASVAAQPPHLLARYLTSLQATTFSTLSRIELDDLQISGWYMVCHEFLTLTCR
jgi:protein CMS1